MSLRPGHIRLPKNEAAEAALAAGYERKQNWKELPGNRCTAGELKAMSGAFADLVMHRRRRKRRVMHLE